MVKGVNKQIIEINDTGSKYFERVLLFVAPGKKDLPNELLWARAKEYVIDFSKNHPYAAPLREKMLKRRARKRVLIISGIIAALSIVAVAIINIL
ncbi:MAG: hypothetical protein J6Q74_02830 [Clostridia bacterium]|nr:hypothetical protein [Clostridia bacterium]